MSQGGKEALVKNTIVDANGFTPLATTGFVKARRKTPVLDVLRMSESFHIDSVGGRVTGRAGDYLVVYEDKTRGIIEKDTFEKEWAVLK